MKILRARGFKGRLRMAGKAWRVPVLGLVVGALLLLCFDGGLTGGPGLPGVRTGLAYDFEPAGCTADDGECMGCATGFWCCKSDRACFDPALNASCNGTVCNGANCSADNLCKKTGITPTITPAVCTETDGQCVNCAVGSWCCKSDGACFDPRTNQSCAGACVNANCTFANVCERRRRLPRTCTENDGTAGKRCTACAPGQLCCARDGTCLDTTNTTCADSACTGDNCNTGTLNLCVAPKPFPPETCSPGHGLANCLTCGVGQYCCMETGSCFDPASNPTCNYTVCGGENCNATQVCRKTAIECPDWKHTLSFTNSSSEKIWLAAIPSCWGAGENRKCHPVPDPGAWILEVNGTATVQVPSCWSGGFLFRTGCIFDKGPTKSEYCDKAPCCKTGDCQGLVTDEDDPSKKYTRSAFVCSTGGQAPTTRVEMTFDGGLDKDGKKIQSLTDYYDVSFVDGWTKMVVVEPTGSNWPGRSPDPNQNNDYWCKRSGCDRSPVCPDPLAFTDKKTAQELSAGSHGGLGAEGLLIHTYCWSPASFTRDLHGKDKTIEVEYNKKKTTCTNDAAFKARLSCVCSTSDDVSCAKPPDSENINPACNDPSGTKDFYGCSPYSEPGRSHLYSQCCPWSTEDKKTCGWNPKDARQAKRMWPDWARDYITNIKSVCQKAYTWQYDDAESTYTCAGKDYGSAVNYAVTIFDGGGGTPPPSVPSGGTAR